MRQHSVGRRCRCGIHRQGQETDPLWPGMAGEREGYLRDMKSGLYVSERDRVLNGNGQEHSVLGYRSSEIE
jgi:hypothetical protein